MSKRKSKGRKLGKKSEASPQKVYRTLYIIGCVTAVVAVVFIGFGFTDKLAICQFNEVDLTNEIKASIFQDGKADDYIKPNEVISLELSFGLWKYCVNGDECKAVKKKSDDAQPGELNS